MLAPYRNVEIADALSPGAFAHALAELGALRQCRSATLAGAALTAIAVKKCRGYRCAFACAANNLISTFEP